MTFSTTWVRSWRDLPEPLPFDDRIEATPVEHERWAAGAPRPTSPTPTSYAAACSPCA